MMQNKTSMNNENTNTIKGTFSGCVFLQIGMKVKIKNDVKNYLFNAGKIKTITRDLPNFGKSRAFELDGEDGIWCIEDFEYCVSYPRLSMR